MIDRNLEKQLVRLLIEPSLIYLGGPRQSGRTTFALEIGKQYPSVYLNLRDDDDRKKIIDPLHYLKDHENELIILDEIERAPSLIPRLIEALAQGLRQTDKWGSFLILGTSSIASLGLPEKKRSPLIHFLELTPFTLSEVKPEALETLWVRGGFPESFLALSDELSFKSRKELIRSYLEREIPPRGFRIETEILRRFWTMIAHHQSEPFNVATLARALGIDGKTAAKYLERFMDQFLIRRLPASSHATGKRQIKAPKIYLRDTGLAHALLGILDKEALLSHPVVAKTWESFVIETLITGAPKGTDASYYRSSNGNEIDLILTFKDGEKWAVQIQRHSRPQVERGFYSACKDLNLVERYLIYPGNERQLLKNNTIALSLLDLCDLLRNR